MKVVTFLFLLVFANTALDAQFHDNHWLLGYAGGNASAPTDSFGISILSFYDAKLCIGDNQYIDLDFNGSSSSFSDFDGNLQFNSNNNEIRDTSDQLIINGILLNNGDPERILPQSFVCLPFASTSLIKYLHTTYTDDFPRLGHNINSADMYIRVVLM